MVGNSRKLVEILPEMQPSASVPDELHVEDLKRGAAPRFLVLILGVLVPRRTSPICFSPRYLVHQL